MQPGIWNGRKAHALFVSCGSPKRRVGSCSHLDWGNNTILLPSRFILMTVRTLPASHVHWMVDQIVKESGGAPSKKKRRKEEEEGEEES